MTDKGVAVLRTKRTVLRDWVDADLAPFAQLNSDPEVMRWFPSTLTRDESDQMAARVRALLREKGWGLWALEVPGVASFSGFVGLNTVPFETSFTPAVEIGWRLDRPWWGMGYATEAAAAALAYGFMDAGLPEIVSFTATHNARSAAVMERIGLRRDPQADFEHPAITVGHPLRRHIVYRMTREEFLSSRE